MKIVFFALPLCLSFIQTVDADPPQGPSVQVLVHQANMGDAYGRDSQWVGSTGKKAALEGVQLSFLENTCPANGMEYMVHMQNFGDSSWVSSGKFVGTRGQSRRLEGIAIRLRGDCAKRFNIWYQCHIEDFGNLPWARDGEFCGTRDQSRRLESLYLVLVPK